MPSAGSPNASDRLGHGRCRFGRGKRQFQRRRVGQATAHPGKMKRLARNAASRAPAPAGPVRQVGEYIIVSTPWLGAPLPIRRPNFTQAALRCDGQDSRAGGPSVVGRRRGRRGEGGLRPHRRELVPEPLLSDCNLPGRRWRPTWCCGSSSAPPQLLGSAVRSNASTTPSGTRSLRALSRPMNMT